MTTGRRAYRQFGLSWGGQIAVIAVQAVYLALVSRLVSPTGFGSYAVAVTITTMATILAQAGLSQAIARKPHATVAEDRGLVSAALVIGGAVSLVVVASSPLWASLWGHPEAAPIVALLAVSLVPVSLSGVQSGILRRTDRVDRLVTGQVAGGVVGALVGVAVTYATRGSAALTVSPILGPAVTVLIYAVMLRGASLPGRLSGASIHDAVFGVKSTGSSFATYVMYSIPQWVMSVQLGPATLGNWNRSVALAQVPAESMRAALLNVAYHRLGRSFVSDRRTTELWTRMVTASLTVVVLAAAVVLPLVPAVTRLVLGPNWDEAPTMILFVAVGAVISLQAGPLSMGLEATGNFRPIYLSQALAGGILVTSAVLEWTLSSWVPYAVGMVLAIAVTYGTQVWLAGQRRLVMARVIARRAAQVVALSIVLLLESLWVIASTESVPLLILNQGLQGALLGWVMFQGRERLRILPSRW